MRTTKKSFMTPVWLCAACFSASLPAADFTFEVPVQIADLHPDITRMAVTCVVSQRDGAGFIDLGGGRQEFTLSGGSYTGTIRVEIDIPDGVPGTRRGPEDANHYSCRLMGINPAAPDGGFYEFGWLQSRFAQYETAPGTTTRIRIQEDF